MVIGIGKYPSIYLFEGNKDMKKLILPIFIAIITIVAVVTFQVQYSKYVQYKEQQEELKLIEQQKKETKKTMEEAEKKRQIWIVSGNTLFQSIKKKLLYQ